MDFTEFNNAETHLAIIFAAVTAGTFVSGYFNKNKDKTAKDLPEPSGMK
ncbi:MAG: hypothetical protein AAF182_00410 [Pseudomonadota bacterium]